MSRSAFAASLVVGAALALATPAWAQSRQRPPASYAQVGVPDQLEGRRILEASRDIGLAGPYYLEFELRVMPRTGAETRIPGRWFGSRNDRGPITRIEVTRPSAAPEVWLIQSGPEPSVWKGGADGWERAESAGAGVAVGGTDISVIDVQTPFMFWNDFVYEGLARFRGRPTHVFLLHPPDEWRDRFPEYAGARVFVDTAWGALSQAQWVDATGGALKTIRLLEAKKIGERWVVKAFEVRDERTRGKTRLSVQAAALDLVVPEHLFAPAGSAGPAAHEVPAAALTVLR